MNKIRRINLFAGSGAGKSVIAAQLFAELKKLNVNIEHIQEYVKIQAIQKRFPKSFDQFHIFGRQLHKEDRILPYVEHIVTDSPLLLNAAYSGCPFWEECIIVANMFEETYPSINIFLDRDGIVYEKDGRYQDLDQAIQMDKNILYLLNSYNITYETIKSIDFPKILSFVKDKIGIGVLY
jgi:hypothetical protein